MVITQASLPPRTALEVFRLLPEGTLCEVLNDTLYMSPAPRYTHQRMVSFLNRRLGDFVEDNNLGEVIISPIDVYFTDQKSALQPDLIFITPENRGILHDDGYFYGAPDLVVEVLSQDIKRDTVTKKAIYEKAGVKEYIMVNPSTLSVKTLLLGDGVYKEVFSGRGVFKSELLNATFPL
ncbi:Uma2 family endonuclease [Parasediminibacterium sp. JCM 36343]|uniref:Uma2 family endonuclease n=1 Tax=Parasediminibacterium sp. JCM 36343 TaxID=3374279 RepID=UPI00397C6456